MYDIGLLIGEKDGLSAAGGATFERLNPVTSDLATRAAAAAPADCRAACDAAAAAFPAWSETGPNARRALLNKAAEVMQARADEFVDAMMGEIGATKGWAMFNIMLASSMLREAAAITTQISGEVIPSDHPSRLCMAVRQPVGVVVGIAPWNAPIILGVRAVATPLACGNTVVLKASEQCPRTHWLIGSVLREAGLPPGAINVVTNAPTDAPGVVEALIEHPAVRRINFTGSTKVGRIIAGIAAKHLKPVLLELGGKSPMVVLRDADVDEAVAAAGFGAFMNQGQICMSTERIVLAPEIADEFVSKFAAKARTLKAGDPREGKTPLGAIVNAEAAAHIRALVEDALAKDAAMPAGGPGEGLIMDATIIDKVTPDMRIYGEESFGPVTTVVRARDEEDAIRIANDTEYGLSACVFTKDIARGLKVARRIQSGICHINSSTVQDEAQMPFGGVKASGVGRFGGKAGIAEFTDLRWITVETDHAHYPI
jgi:acyl-CoA reductase-like NAD-dependent aldehyde dehydrogenase